MKKAKCENYNYCELALSDKIFNIESHKNNLCTECKEPLVEIAKKKPKLKPKRKFNWFRRAKREGVCRNDKNCNLALSDKVIKIYTKEDVRCKECHSLLEIRKITKKKRSYKKISFWLILIGLLGYFTYDYRYKITIPPSIESIFFTPKEFTKENIEIFLNDLITVNEKDDAKETLTYYALISNYYKYKRKTREEIYKIKINFYKRYPKRKFDLKNIKIIEKYTQNQRSYCKLVRDINYRYESPSHEVKEGVTTESLLIERYLNGFQIVEIKTQK